MIDEILDERQLECEKRHDGCRTCPYKKEIGNAVFYPCVKSKESIENTK